MKNIFFLLFIFTISNSAFSAGVYKWKDADGNVHYGDRPTKFAEEIKIKTKSKPDKNIEQRTEKRERLLNVLSEEREAKKSDKLLLAQQKASKQKQCEDAKNNLQKYITAGYLYKLDNQGGRIVLEDKEHAEALSDAQKSVDQWCS